MNLTPATLCRREQIMHHQHSTLNHCHKDPPLIGQWPFRVHQKGNLTKLDKQTCCIVGVLVPASHRHLMVFPLPWQKSLFLMIVNPAMVGSQLSVKLSLGTHDGRTISWSLLTCHDAAVTSETVEDCYSLWSCIYLS